MTARFPVKSLDIEEAALVAAYQGEVTQCAPSAARGAKTFGGGRIRIPRAVQAQGLDALDASTAPEADSVEEREAEARGIARPSGVIPAHLHRRKGANYAEPATGARFFSQQKGAI